MSPANLGEFFLSFADVGIEKQVFGRVRGLEVVIKKAFSGSCGIYRGLSKAGIRSGEVQR